MNLEKLNHWLTLAANVCVLAGIVFLGIEIQQSNRIAVVTSELGIVEGYNNFNAAVYDEKDMSVLLAQAMSPEAEFSPDEKLALRFWCIVFLNIHRSAEIAYFNGMASDATYIGNLADARTIVERYPALHDELRSLVSNYQAESEFVKTLSQLLSESNN